MAVKIASLLNDQQFNSNGTLLSGGKIETFLAGSSTPATTFTTDAGNIAQSNPIILNTRGEVPNPIYLTTGVKYKLVLKDSVNNVLRTYDNIEGVNDSSSGIDQWINTSVAPVFVNTTTFTLAGDQTNNFHVNRRVKLFVTAGTLYGFITASVFSTLTTVTVVLDSGVLDSGLSSVQVGLLSFTNSAIAKVNTSYLNYDNGTLAARNKIIGGDFTTNPWQRGTGFVNPAGLHTADRWGFQKAGTSAVNIAKAAEAPTAEQAGIFTQHSLHANVTTAQASMAAGDVVFHSHKVEGLNAASFGFGQAGARFVTLSFWVRSAKAGIHCVAFRNSANNRSYVAEYIVNAINTFEKKVLTIPVDNAGAWLYDNGMGIQVSFILAVGSTFQTAAGAWTAGNFAGSANQVNVVDAINNTFLIALVQLEAGSTATAFETRSVGQELALCQRYYETSPYACIGRSTGTDHRFYWPYKVSKRAAATITLTTTTIAFEESQVASRGVTAASINSSGGDANQTIVQIIGTNSNGVTAAGPLLQLNTIGCFAASSEL